MKPALSHIWLEGYCRFYGLDRRVFGDEMKWVYVKTPGPSWMPKIVRHVHPVTNLLAKIGDPTVPIEVPEIPVVTLNLEPYTITKYPNWGTRTIWLAVCNCNQIFWSD